MSSGHEKGAERFAGAWEQQEDDHRSSPGSARRSPNGNAREPHPDDPTMRTPALDPELRRDLDLAAALRDASRSVPGPDVDESARMRAALMAAIGGDTVADEQDGRVLGGAGSGSAGGRGAGRAGRPSLESRRSPRAARTVSTAGPTRHRPVGSRPEASRPPARPERDARSAGRRSSRGRIVSKVIAGACAVLLLGALTVVLSRGALPGEMLYGVKRASESVEMGLTGGQEAKGRKHLDFAALRLEEVSGLVERPSATAAGAGPVAGGVPPEDASLVAENLQAFDEQARAGSRIMLPLARQPSGPEPAELTAWAREQSSRLEALRPSFSAEDRAAASSSQELLARLSARASALDERRSCPEVSTGDDELGPVPSSARCAAVDGPVADRVPAAETASRSATTTTTTPESSPRSESSTDSADETTSTTTTTSQGTAESTPAELGTPAPVQVPMPVPLLPQVEVPSLLPGMPGIGLGG